MLSLLLRLLSKLPLPVLQASTPLIYVIVYYLARARRAVVQENLAQAFPEKTALERRQTGQAFYRHYSEVMVEMVKSFSISKQALLDRVTFNDAEILQEYLDNGQAVLATAAHHCNIEWLLLACSAKFSCPFEAIYRPLSDTQLEKLSYDAHRRFGGTPINDRAVVKEIMARRNVPRIIAIVPDQSPNVGDDKHWVSFLNQETAFFLAPEVVAKFAKYPVVFLGMQRTGRGRYQINVSRLAEPPYTNDHLITERYVSLVEQQIRNDPSNWLWAHKRWKHRRSLYEQD